MEGEGLFTPRWEAERGKKNKKKTTKVLPGAEDWVRDQQKWLSKEGMTARWKAPAQRALFNMLRQPRGLPLLSHPTPALSSTLSAFIAWCCHSVAMLPKCASHPWWQLTSDHPRYWLTAPSVFSLLCSSHHCDHVLSHAYCRHWPSQHESLPKLMALGKSSLPWSLTVRSWRTGLVQGENEGTF